MSDSTSNDTVVSLSAIRREKMLRSASSPTGGRQERPVENHSEIRVLPLYYALVHLQYMHELDTWPKQRADLQQVVIDAMPKGLYEPLPLTVEVSEEVYQCIIAINTRDALKVLEQKFDEELGKVYPCNDS